MNPGKAKRTLQRRLDWIRAKHLAPGREGTNHYARAQQERAALEYALAAIEMRKVAEERARLDQHRSEATTYYHDDAGDAAAAPAPERLDQLLPGCWS